MNAEVVTIKGEKFALLPFAMWEQMVETLEDAQDIAQAKEIKRRIAAGDGEYFPEQVITDIVMGKNKIKVYREYRGMTQAILADKSGVSVDTIKRLETSAEGGSVKTIKAIANALSIDVDMLI